MHTASKLKSTWALDFAWMTPDLNCDDQGPSDTRVILILIAAMMPRALGVGSYWPVHADCPRLPCIAPGSGLPREDGRGVQLILRKQLRVPFPSRFFTPQNF
eukprot:COSAG02_NODE_5350_length_4408_cov_48.603852_2_plen_102_part_00